MKDLPDFSLFLKKNYALSLLGASLVGESNELVFKLQTIDNQWFGLKIYRSAGAPGIGQLDETWSFLAFLGTKKLTVQSPVLTLDGAVSTSIFFEKKDCPAVLFNWLDGRPVRRFGHVSTVKNWGGLLGQLHAASMDFSSKKKPKNGAGDFSPKTNLTALDENFVQKTADWLPQTLPGHGFTKNETALFSEKLRSLAARADFFEKTPTNFGLIHSDLHPGNLLRVGQKLTAIDWDDLAFGPFLLDIAVVFNEFYRFQAEKILTLRATFLAGYRSKNDLPADFGARFPAALDMADLLFAAWAFHPKNGFARTEKGLRLGKMAAKRLIGPF